MKDPRELAKTIYLGDRVCKCLLMDGWNKRVSIQVDFISRIRDASGRWNFYTDEDIKDGRIVFESVRYCSIEPQGLLPCDWIEFVTIEPASNSDSRDDTPAFLFTLSLGAVDAGGNAQELIMRMIAEDMYLEDPTRSGAKIIE